SNNESLEWLSTWADELAKFEYDRILNLSFSPFSSFLTHFLSHSRTKVRGYTRSEDGYLSIPDDPSAYFYAQVGVGKSNRAHLTEIFASIAEVELVEEDWQLADYQRSPEARDRVFNQFGIPTKDEFIVLHIAASDLRKTLNWEQWAVVITKLFERWKGSVILVGGVEDRLFADRIQAHCSSSNLFSLVGKVQLSDLLSCLSFSSLVVGGDSVLMQMASLAQVECFCLSFPIVNFWETGPLEPGSRVLILNHHQPVECSQIAEEIGRQLHGLSPLLPMAIASGETPVHFFVENYFPEDDFQWAFIQALYMRESYPVPPNELIFLGFRRLRELSDLALSQIATLNKEGLRALAVDILAQIDIMIAKIRQMVPELEPLVSWFETEKLRIGPGSLDDLASRTRQIFESLKMVANLYLEDEINNNQNQGEMDGSKDLVS
ncbi:MAG: hypothetical protein KDD35_06035, partial [Bdellovibrionales bacterium]|nr:hypothetical protein [Bdellovibrionales bacterium]